MTIADTIYDTIVDNWGSGGYAGDTPEFDATETQKSSDAVSTDVIEVRHYSLHETGRQVNDKYVNRHYVIDVYISSKTSNVQLKLLYDEVEYLLRNTAMTGIQLERIDKDWSVTRWEQGRHSVILKVYVVALLSDGAVTPAAGSTEVFARAWPQCFDWNFGGGTSRGTLHGSIIYMPAADDNCTLFGGINIPTGWPSGKQNYLKIRYTCFTANQAYSGLWHVAANALGEAKSSYNILNVSTAYDFALVDTQYKVAVNSVDIGATIEANDHVGFYFVSDALNGTILAILGAWVEYE